MSGAGQGGAPAGKGGADPAMDDILASIRRILNEDEAGAGMPAAAQPTPPAAKAPAEPEPIELTEAMMVEPPATPPAAPLAAPPAPPAPPPEPVTVRMEVETAPLAAPEPPAPPPAEALMAPAVAAATTAALGQLLRTVAAERSAPVHRGGPSIEDVVREELRPLLKAWLDQHLPPLVERLVRAEIERVAGRAL